MAKLRGDVHAKFIAVHIPSATPAFLRRRTIAGSEKISAAVIILASIGTTSVVIAAWVRPTAAFVLSPVRPSTVVIPTRPAALLRQPRLDLATQCLDLSPAG